MFNPWIRKIPWSRKWQPTPVFLEYMENPMERGAWWAIVHGVTKGSDTTEQLKNSNKYTAFLQSSILEVDVKSSNTSSNVKKYAPAELWGNYFLIYFKLEDNCFTNWISHKCVYVYIYIYIYIPSSLNLPSQPTSHPLGHHRDNYYLFYVCICPLIYAYIFI